MSALSRDASPYGLFMTTLRWLAIIVLLTVPIVAGCGAQGGENPSAHAAETPSTAAVPAQNAEEEAIDSLMSGFEVRRFEDVVNGAKKFAQDFPDSPRRAMALYLSGRASIAMGHYDEGMATLKKMLERYPEDENVPFGDFYLAQAIYLKGYVPASEYKISAEEALPLYQQALEAFKDVAERHAGDAEVATRSRLMMAQVLHSMGRREEALARFKAYLEEDTGGDFAYQTLFQIGTILSELERTEEAREAFIRLSKEYPGNPHSGTAIDLVRELNLVGNRMPPLRISHWMDDPADSKDYKGKVLLITFWNVRCPHCQHEMPKLEALYRKLKDRGLVALGLTNLRRGQTLADVRQFIDQKQLSFPIGLDQAGRTANAYAVNRIPAVAIVDREGIIRWRNSGELVTESLLERFL
jgi:TolA-binding protein